MNISGEFVVWQMYCVSCMWKWAANLQMVNNSACNCPLCHMLINKKDMKQVVSVVCSMRKSTATYQVDICCFLTALTVSLLSMQRAYVMRYYAEHSSLYTSNVAVETLGKCLEGKSSSRWNVSALDSIQERCQTFIFMLSKQIYVR